MPSKISYKYEQFIRVVLLCRKIFPQFPLSTQHNSLRSILRNESIIFSVYILKAKNRTMPHPVKMLWCFAGTLHRFLMLFVLILSLPAVILLWNSTFKTWCYYEYKLIHLNLVRSLWISSIYTWWAWRFSEWVLRDQMEWYQVAFLYKFQLW